MMNEPVAMIMRDELYTASPSNSLQTIKDLIDKNKIHHVPIVEGSKLVGIITTYDLLLLNEKFENYPNILAKDIMITKVATVTPRDKVGTVAEVILLNRFHALLVVDEDRNLVGIVTVMDLLKYSFKKEYPAGYSIHEKIL